RRARGRGNDDIGHGGCPLVAGSRDLVAGSVSRGRVISWQGRSARLSHGAALRSTRALAAFSHPQRGGCTPAGAVRQSDPWGKGSVAVAEEKHGGRPAGERAGKHADGGRAEDAGGSGKDTGGKVVIKKYANRRLYNTAKS